MEYDFNSSLYDSPGTSILSNTQVAAVQKSDTSYLDNFINLIGAGSTAYANIVTAQAAKKTTVVDTASPKKVATPVIGTPAEQATLTTRAKVIIGGAVAAVLLIVGLLLFRRK
jgi:hypothetical protein